jgi:hypothetical protein
LVLGEPIIARRLAPSLTRVSLQSRSPIGSGRANQNLEAVPLVKRVTQLTVHVVMPVHVTWKETNVNNFLVAPA